jgi:hypothetical protein
VTVTLKGLMLVVVVVLAVQVPHSVLGEVGYKSGLTLPLPNGHTFSVQYNASISDNDVRRADAVLREYLPKLFDLFWTPTVGELVSVDQDISVCVNASACAQVDHVHLNDTVWADPTTWIHEFAHVLQFSLGAYLSDEAGLFYVEPTAIEAAAVVTNKSSGYSTGGNNALWISDWGVSLATLDYVIGRLRNETHITTPIWSDLYGVDHNVFRKLNQRLHQLSQERWYVSDIPSLRQLLSEAVSVSTLDGLPVRKWLAVEGMLGRAELGSEPTVSVGLDLSQQRYDLAGQIFIAFESYSINGVLKLNPNKTTGSVYDAFTHHWLANIPRANTGNFPGFIGLSTTLNMTELPNVIRVDVHVVGDNVDQNQSILIPVYSPNYEHSFLVATSDGWLQPINGNVTIGNQTDTLTNGFSYFKPLVGMSTISYPGGSIENCLPDVTNIVVGLNFKALSIMHDTTSVTLTKTISQTSPTANSPFNQPAIGVLLIVILVVYMLFKNREYLRRAARRRLRTPFGMADSSSF